MASYYGKVKRIPSYSGWYQTFEGCLTMIADLQPPQGRITLNASTCATCCTPHLSHAGIETDRNRFFPSASDLGSRSHVLDIRNRNSSISDKTGEACSMQLCARPKSSSRRWRAAWTCMGPVVTFCESVECADFRWIVTRSKGEWDLLLDLYSTLQFSCVAKRECFVRRSLRRTANLNPSKGDVSSYYKIW